MITTWWNLGGKEKRKKGGQQPLWDSAKKKGERIAIWHTKIPHHPVDLP